MTDPRLATTTIASGPEEGDELEVIEPVTVHGTTMWVPKLLPGAAEYVTVAEAEAEANRLHAALLGDLDKLAYFVGIPIQRNAADFVVTAGTAVTVAATGLEAFANHHVATFCLPQVYDLKGEPYGPPQTITLFDQTFTFRELADRPLHERLGKFIPEAFGIPKPTGHKWWSKLRQIQTLAALNRHGITDPIRRPGLDGVKPLHQRLFDREYAGAAQTMLDVFEFISPGWFGKQRELDLPPPPEN